MIKPGWLPLWSWLNICSSDLHIKHGPIQLLFTCDEEIGQGTAKIRVDEICAIGGLYARRQRSWGDGRREFFSRSTCCQSDWSEHPSIDRQRTHDQCPARFEPTSCPATAGSSLSPESTEGSSRLPPSLSFEPVASAKRNCDCCFAILIPRSWMSTNNSSVDGIAFEVEQSMPGLKLEPSRECASIAIWPSI